MKNKMTFFIISIVLSLSFSCDFKKEQSPINEPKEVLVNDAMINEIANSPQYKVLDRLRAELNLEVRTAYNYHLINRSKNNTGQILKTYQSELPFSEKRALLKDLELDLPEALDDLAMKIEKTENELASLFPVLKGKKNQVMERVLAIKPQSGVSNPLNLKLP